MVTQVKQIETAIEELQVILIKIKSISLELILPQKFELRKCKVSIEIDAFIQALQRQLTPAKKKAAKLEKMNVDLAVLNKELGIVL